MLGYTPHQQCVLRTEMFKKSSRLLEKSAEQFQLKFPVGCIVFSLVSGKRSCTLVNAIIIKGRGGNFTGFRYATRVNSLCREVIPRIRYKSHGESGVKAWIG